MHIISKFPVDLNDLMSVMKEAINYQKAINPKEIKFFRRQHMAQIQSFYGHNLQR